MYQTALGISEVGKKQTGKKRAEFENKNMRVDFYRLLSHYGNTYLRSSAILCVDFCWKCGKHIPIICLLFIWFSLRVHWNFEKWRKQRERETIEVVVRANISSLSLSYLSGSLFLVACACMGSSPIVLTDVISSDLFYSFGSQWQYGDVHLSLIVSLSVFLLR